MTKQKLHRRDLLRGLGGVAIALPWLEAAACGYDGERMAGDGGADADRYRLGIGSRREPSSADAGPPPVNSDRPRRLIIITTPNGTLSDRWFPSGGERDFRLGPITMPFEPHRRDIVLLKGVDQKYDGGTHFEPTSALLTCREAVGPSEGAKQASGISIDQVIAQAINANPMNRTRFSSFELGTNQNTNGVGALAYSGARMPLPKTNSPRALFNRVFAAGTGSSAEQRRRQSILDGVREEQRRLAMQLGGEDRARLEAYLTSLRETEQRLGNTGGMCTAPMGFSAGTTDDDQRRLPAMVREMLDVLALSLACDATRVVTYPLRSDGGGSNQTFGWLGIGPSPDPFDADTTDDSNSTSHHSMSHNDTTPQNIDRLTRVNAWYMQQIVYLIEKLKAIPEGTGTVFDNTAILYTSPIARGNHSKNDLPMLIAGSCGGRISTGRFLRLDAQSHAGVLVALANAMGVEMTTFGDPRYWNRSVTLS